MGRVRKKKKGQGCQKLQLSEVDNTLLYQLDFMLESFTNLLLLVRPYQCLHREILNMSDKAQVIKDMREQVQQIFLTTLDEIATYIDKKKRSRHHKRESVFLFKIEEKASFLRLCIEDFYDLLRKERDELLKLGSKLRSSANFFNYEITQKKEHIMFFDPHEVMLMGKTILSKCMRHNKADLSILEYCLFLLNSINGYTDTLSSQTKKSTIVNEYNTTTMRSTESTHFRTLVYEIRNTKFVDLTLYESAMKIIKDALVYKQNLGKINFETTQPHTYEQSKEKRIDFSSKKSQRYVKKAITYEAVPLLHMIKYEDSTTESTMEVVERFLFRDKKLSREITSKLYGLLLHGPTGSGKSFLCDHIYNFVTKHEEKKCKVIYPNLPLDLTAGKVGLSEAILLSTLLQSVAGDSSWKKCILIFDDLNHILGECVGNEKIDYFPLKRLKSTLLGMLESVEIYAASPIEALLLVCTSNDSEQSHQERLTGAGTQCISTLSCFNDKIQMNSLDKRQLQLIVAAVLNTALPLDSKTKFHNEKTKVDSIDSSALADSFKDIADQLWSCCVGKTVAEIAYNCRKAIAENENLKMHAELSYHNGKPSSAERLQILEKRFHHFSPMIPTSELSGIVDLKIYSSKQLLAGSSPMIPLPLLGKQARRAWDELKTLIVFPLTKREEVNRLMYGDKSQGLTLKFVPRDQKTICAGALISGKQGSGKSVLATYCASYAASMKSAVKLIHVSCTSLIHKEVGGSENAVSKLFAVAKNASPCILLLDGLENIAPKRGIYDNTSEGTIDRVVTTLLTEIDGIDSTMETNKKNSLHGVAVIGITSNPEMIDSAIRRPGRLEKCVMLEYPDHDTRYELITKEIDKLRDEKIDFCNHNEVLQTTDEVATEMRDMSAAEVKLFCAKAALLALKRKVFLDDGGNDDLLMRHSRSLSHLGIPNALLEEKHVNMK